MKIFEPESFAERQQIVRNTKSEFEIIQSLNLSSIPTYFEFAEKAIWRKSDGSQTEVCYLLMEYLQGVELNEFFNSLRIQKEEAYLRYIFYRLVYTLNKLHEAGIAHRDVKLENIMITTSHEVKLIDLGYMTKHQSNQLLKSRVGTETYMAPEIIA